MAAKMLRRPLQFSGSIISSNTFLIILVASIYIRAPLTHYLHILYGCCVEIFFFCVHFLFKIKMTADVYAPVIHYVLFCFKHCLLQADSNNKM